MKTPHLRTIAEFAEAEIILNDGPSPGRFRLSRAPAARLLFAELASGRWSRVFVLGPNQDGKTLCAFIIVVLYLLFERRETVLIGVPSKEIATDKWLVDLKPAIEASRYRALLPDSGAGSKDGVPTLIQFGNGAKLRIMTGGGGDQSRAAFATPNLIVTEVNGFDATGTGSAEGSKFDQLERRLLAFASRGRLVAESTVGFEQSRAWQEYRDGTQSRIALQCPHCMAWVTPERKDFVGWETADSDQAAAAIAAIHCPECGAAWSNQERLEANNRAILVHKGQTVDAAGVVAGEAPKTSTLGFRWTVVNSVLNAERMSLVGAEEWRAKRSPDPEAADRDLSQRQWVLPAKADAENVSESDAFAIVRRTRYAFRGICPPGTQCITTGLDVGKWWLHWTAIAWLPNATPHVIDYGVQKVPSDFMGEEEAILHALREWRDEIALRGWLAGEERMTPTFGFVDCGNWRSTVLRFTEEVGPPFFPTAGYGFGQRRAGATYQRETGSKVVGTGDGYAYIRQPDGRQYVEVKADHWKSWVHARLQTPVDRSGALTLCLPDPSKPNDHLDFARHLTAEVQVKTFDPREGTIIRWTSPGRKNHWLDSTALACVAGYEAGMRLLEPVAPPPPPPAVAPPATRDTPWVPETSNWLDR